MSDPHAQEEPHTLPNPTPNVGHGAPELVLVLNGRTWTLDASRSYTLGRDPQGDIVLGDARVSSRHATISWDGRRWVIEDLGSTNGTFVQGQRIHQMEIGPGSAVHLGNATDGPLLSIQGWRQAEAAAEFGPLGPLGRGVPPPLRLSPPPPPLLHQSPVGSPPPPMLGISSRVGGAGEADACPGCGVVYPRMWQRLRGARGRHEASCRLASVPLRHVAGLDMADALLLLGQGESQAGGDETHGPRRQHER